MDRSNSNPDGEAPAPPRRRPSWLNGRVVVLMVLCVAVGLVAAWRIHERLGEPSAGDRYDVTYDAEDCGYIYVRADGLLLRGSADLDEPAVAAGDGSLVLRRVWDLSGRDGGLGASGELTLADGNKMTVDGGTEGKAFFTLACTIRGS